MFRLKNNIALARQSLTILGILRSTTEQTFPGDMADVTNFKTAVRKHGGEMNRYKGE